MAAVFHRTSLGVASLEASERFGLGPAALGTFTVLQIGVYALMQVPTGLLVDRFGPRRVLTVAAAADGAGPGALRLRHVLPARPARPCGARRRRRDDVRQRAAPGRRALPAPPLRRDRLVHRRAGRAGQPGLDRAADAAARRAGWTATFAIAGAVTAAYSVVLVLRVRDNPIGVRRSPSTARSHCAPCSPGQHAWRTPGTRLGFWVHFSTMFAPAMLGLLWGFPYLVQAQGMSEPGGRSVLSVLVVGAIVGGPVGRHADQPAPGVADRRMVVGYLVAALGGVGGAARLAGRARAAAVLVAGVRRALARRSRVDHRVRAGQGLQPAAPRRHRDRRGQRRRVRRDHRVRARGRRAAGRGGPVGPATAFRIAFSSVVAVLVLGLWRTSVWWRRARAAVFDAAERGEDVPVRIRRRSWDLAPATSRRG